MQYKTGIIGYGGMGHYHAHRVSELTDCVKTTAVYDIRQSQRDEAAAKGFEVYDNLADFLKSDIDIAVIATPNHEHKRLSIAALRAGKNVICEKPVTLNAGELEEIIAVAKETGKQFAVHQNRRWDGCFLRVKKTVEEGLIGNPFYIKQHLHSGGGGAIYGWRSDKANGGGFLADWGVHLLDRAIWLMGPAKIIEVNGVIMQLRSMSDDNAIINVTFDNGARVLVETMQYAGYPQPLLEVHGDRGCIVINNEEDKGKLRVSKITGEHIAENLCYREQGPCIIKSRVLDETFEEIPVPEIDLTHDSRSGNDWSKYYENYTAALDGREQLIVRPEQSLRVMKVIDMAFESSRTGHSISCEL